MKAKLGFAGGFEDKLPLLVAFSVVYGLVFINYIDIFTSGTIYGYHLWLVLMYFLPFASFFMLNLKNWNLTLGLGLTASLMNDVFYGLMHSLFGLPIDLTRYYTLWLIPRGEMLFTLNLGFADIPVYSWMMALSIYGRIIIVFFLLKAWRSQAKIHCLEDAEKKRRLVGRWSG